MIERNVIFIHPLSEKLRALKEELENNDENLIFEIDALNEYGQVVGVLEHSITFSSDLKKTRIYLDDYAQFVKSKTAKNFLVQENTIAPHIFSKLQSQGLNEVLKEKSDLKSLTHKVDLFFNGFNSDGEKDSLSSSIGGMAIGGNKAGFEDKQTIKNQAVFDTAEGLFNFDSKKRKKIPTFDHSQFSNFELKKNKTDLSFLDNPLSNYQRKNIPKFLPQLKELDLKRTLFNPISGELKKNPYKQSLGLIEPGALPKRRTSFQEVEREAKDRKKLNLPELINKNKKGLGFKPRLQGLKPKSGKLDLPLLDLKRKKGLKFEPIEPKKKKRAAKFQEVEIERERKKLDLDEKELDLKKKKKIGEDEIGKQSKKPKFEEVGPGQKPRKKFEEAEIEHERQRGMFEEAQNEKKKENSQFKEVEREASKRKKFDELDVEVDRKRTNIDEVEKEKNKRGKFEEVEREKADRKKLELDEKDLSKKKKQFEETLIEGKSRAKFEEIEKEKSTKKSQFQEKDDKDLVGQIGHFEELKRRLETSKKDEELSNEEYESILKYDKNKKNGPETILDYRQLKKEMKEGKLKASKELEEKISRKACDEIAKIEDSPLYEFDSYGMEYLVAYNDLIWKSSEKPLLLLKFVHFSLMKEMEGEVVFFVGSGESYDVIYQGLKTAGEDNAVIVQSLIDKWGEITLPTWSDETFQSEVMDFVYPFFEDGEKLGFCIARFYDSVKNHDQAKKVELLITMAKGVYLENSLL